ncbi:MAG: tetratricopeptide repeat protein, partial [Bdellovibrionia bacterium]
MKNSLPKIFRQGVRLGTLSLLVGVKLSSIGYAGDAKGHALKAQGGSPPHSEGKNHVTAKSKFYIDSKDKAANAEHHFSMAQAYASDGEADKAIEEYKLTLMFDPESALVYARLATEYVKKGMLSAAMETCKEALQRDPNFTDVRLILAGLYSTAHETEAALTEYDRILKKDPKNEEAVVYKAQVLLEDGKGAQSVIVLRHFVKDNPNSGLVHYYLGRAEQQQDHFAEAETSYKKALAEKRGFTQAALALGYLYEEKQKISDALGVYKKLFDDTQDISAASRLATIYLKQEKYTQAIPYLQAIEASDSEDLNVRVKLGLIHMEMKQYDAAIKVFKKILEKSPDSDRIHYYLGSLYEENKQPDLAIKELKQVKSDSRLFPEAALHAAYLLRVSRRIVEAKSFMKGIVEGPHHTANFFLFQASLEEETKNLDESIRILEKAVKEYPENEKVRYYLGSLYDRQGNVDKGVDQMQAILKINPENVDALNYVAYTWTQKGINLNDAELLLKRALKLRPENGYIQ